MDRAFNIVSSVGLELGLVSMGRNQTQIDQLRGILNCGVDLPFQNKQICSKGTLICGNSH